MAWQETGKKIPRGNFYPLQNNIFNIEQAQTLQLINFVVAVVVVVAKCFKKKKQKPNFFSAF